MFNERQLSLGVLGFLLLEFGPAMDALNVIFAAAH